MDPDQTAPAPKVDDAPPENLTVVEFAARRASRQAAALLAVSGATPVDLPAPPSEPVLEGQPAPAPDPAPPSGETLDPAPQAAGPAGLEAFIAKAIQEASTAPDRARAIAKMAGRIAEMAAQRDQALARTQAAPPPPAQATAPADPPATVPDIPAHLPLSDAKVAQLDAQLMRLKTALKTISQNPDGYTFTDGEGQERSLSPEELGDLKFDYEQQQRELGTRREFALQTLEEKAEVQRQAAGTLATKHYGWLNNKAAPEFQLAVSELRELGPVAHILKQSPLFNLVMGRYVRGLQAERAADLAATRPPSASRPPSNGAAPPRVVAGSTTRNKVDALAARITAAEAEVKDTGSVKAFSNLRSLRNQRAATAA